MAEYKVLTANKFGFLCDDEAGDSEAEIKKAVMDNAAKQAAEKKKAAEEAVAAAEEKIAAEKALSAAKPVRKEGGCPARRGDRAGGRGGRGGRREDRAPRGGRREGAVEAVAKEAVRAVEAAEALAADLRSPWWKPTSPSWDLSKRRPNLKLRHGLTPIVPHCPQWYFMSTNLL
ncbi:hypothetical protein L596_014025 [Steinernema carpocapsae]|uniref:Uncharacterized protein n=1 Tax=Steinernema carpocapsae TaxID=34508 RepID=A0A4U5NAH0_STECR|nr:hypothetical protein L596_014025 [Steinernema carpocapsae]